MNKKVKGENYGKTMEILKQIDIFLFGVALGAVLGTAASVAVTWRMVCSKSKGRQPSSEFNFKDKAPRPELWKVSDSEYSAQEWAEYIARTPEEVKTATAREFTR